MELRSGPPKKRKLPQSIQSPEGVHLIPSRDGRIELRGPSAPSARLAEDIRIYREPGRRSARTYGSVVRLRRPTRPRPLGEPANPAVPIRLKTKRPSSIAAEEPNRDGRIRTGDPLNPITNSLHAISREIPGFMRVLEKISWNRNPGFQRSRGSTSWRTYWSERIKRRQGGTVPTVWCGGPKGRGYRGPVAIVVRQRLDSTATDAASPLRFPGPCREDPA